MLDEMIRLISEGYKVWQKELIKMSWVFAMAVRKIWMK